MDKVQLIIIREIDRVKSQLLRARCLAAEATLTLVDWLTILDTFGWRCAYCQAKPFQVMSHVIPLSHGGTTADNCVPACYGCCGRRRTKDQPRIQAYLTQLKSGCEHAEEVSSSHQFSSPEQSKHEEQAAIVEPQISNLWFTGQG